MLIVTVNSIIDNQAYLTQYIGKLSLVDSELNRFIGVIVSNF